MKKLFGRKRQESDYDEWDDLDTIEEDEYYESEEEDEYYESEEEDEYYESEEEDEYYESEEEDEYYESEEEGEYYESEEEGEYYESEEEDALYESEETNPKEHRGIAYARRKKTLWMKFCQMALMDRVMVITGGCVILLALIIGLVYGSSRLFANQVSSMKVLGSQLDGIHVIGESGILAVGDAELARIESMNEEETGKEPSYDEEEFQGEKIVTVNLTSIMKDLKIKFVNRKTGKLVANVPFSVLIKDPDGNVTTWSDDDLDGILYKKNIKPGNYVVELQEISDEKYADYLLETGSKTVEVKENIEYEKVDVSDEIKSEAEVDAEKEDTKKNETEEESKLQDTVAFVETTKTYVGNTYKEVAKNAITDPMKLAYNGMFVRLSEVGDVSPSNPSVTPPNPPVTPPNPPVSKSVTLEPGTIQGKVGEGTVTIQAKVIGIVDGATYSWTSNNTNVASVNGNGATALVTFVGKGEAIITCTVDGVAANCTVTVAEAEKPTYTLGTVSISQKNLSIALNDSAKKLSADITGFLPEKAQLVTEWISSNPNVATIEKESGEIKPKAEGTTEITLKVFFKDAPEQMVVSAPCVVTVTKNRTLTFDYTTATAFVKKDFMLLIHPNPAFTNPKKEQFTVKTSDASIATAILSDDFKNVIVKPLKKGEVSVILTYQESATAPVIETVCKMTVKEKDPKTDTETRLKDNTGNELWVLVDEKKNEYREAVYADYYKYEKFYIKSGEEYKYTGWTRIGNKVYYYKTDGKYVTGEQVIQGAKYNFASDGTLITGNGVMGIDVSKWNGSINWTDVKNSGVSYVIIRCGYRGSSQGSLIVDPKFKANIKGATDAGLKVGVYFFSQAVDEIEAVEEASMVLGLIKPYRISYPVFLDVEPSGGRADKIDKNTRTAVIKAFCETIQNSGYTAGVYANKTWLNNKIDTSQLAKYKIWLAQYAKQPTYGGRYEMWQYTSKGKVKGISGEVDMNLSYLGY